MTVNWPKILQEQRDNAREIAASTIELLAQSDFTQEEVSQLYMAARVYAHAFTRIMDDLKKHEVDEIAFDMAQVIEAMWDTVLSVLARHFEEP
jgi:hypothetical protein